MHAAAETLIGSGTAALLNLQFNKGAGDDGWHNLDSGSTLVGASSGFRHGELRITLKTSMCQ